MIDKRPVHADHGGASFDALGHDFSHLERAAEIVNADVLDAWYPPSPIALAALEEHLEWLVRTSPPTHAEGLTRTIAEVRGVPPECVLVSGGSSSLIFMVLPQLVKPGDRACLLDPMYGEYAHVIEAVHGMRCQRSPQDPADGFRIHLETLLEDVAACDVTILVNPNSPTGAHLTRDQIGAVLDKLPRFGLLVVDETYVDFLDSSDEPPASVETWAAEREDLIVIKSLSKFHALSGLRVGYLVASPDAVARLRPHVPPWSVSLPAQIGAIEALRDGGYYSAMAAQTRGLREAMAVELAAIPGLRVFPSVANFLLLELTAPGASASDVVEAAVACGVYLRNCDSQGTRFGGRFLRTAVKDATSNARIAATLREVVPVPPPASVEPPSEEVPPLTSGAEDAEGMTS